MFNRSVYVSLFDIYYIVAILESWNGHNFGRRTLKDFMIQISFHSSQWIWRRFSKISNSQPTRKFGVHLEWRVRSPDLILEEDHRRPRNDKSSLWLWWANNVDMASEMHKTSCYCCLNQDLRQQTQCLRAPQLRTIWLKFCIYSIQSFWRKRSQSDQENAHLSLCLW